MRLLRRVRVDTSIAVCLVSLLGAASAGAATICVNPHGTSGCESSISAAVTAANAGDTIIVAPGTYAEDVKITKSLSIIGQDSENTIINAMGFPNGVYIDGYLAPAPGLSHVVVTGFTVENAKFEGILVHNASFVTIWGNHVRDNDENLVYTASPEYCTDQAPVLETLTTPPTVTYNGGANLAPFETNEGDDCGEGIHLIGVDHSTLADNIVEHNSGGILVSDETAANHDNVITRNEVHDNPYDCGITVASHSAYSTIPGPPSAFGIYHITISENDSYNNGLGLNGAGAGVGLFAPAPFNKTYDNSVVRNRLTGNGLPGVAIHNHAPGGADVNDNVIVGNYISGNGSDSDVPTSVPTGISVLGVTPVTGLVISDNVIRNEQIDVAVNSASSLDLPLNDLLDGTYGIDNLNAGGTVNAAENWWGCPSGPGKKGCSAIEGSGTTVYAPWLTMPLNEDQYRDQDQARNW